MTLAGRGLATAAGFFLSIAPAIAQACPQCAGRSYGGVGQYVVLGSFVFLPFLVTAVVYRFVKAGEDSSRSPL